MGSRFIASRIRLTTKEAVFVVRPYSPAISFAEMPVSVHVIALTTSTHVRMGTFEPWRIVPVSTEKGLRQPAHFQTRR